MHRIEDIIASVEAEVKKDLSCVRDIISINVWCLRQCRLQLESESLLLEQWALLNKIERGESLSEADYKSHDQCLQGEELVLDPPEGYRGKEQVPRLIALARDEASMRTNTTRGWGRLASLCSSSQDAA